MIDELKFLQKQGQSMLGAHGHGGPSYVVEKKCHLCGDETERGKNDPEVLSAWICYECDTERSVARRDLKKG